MKKAAGSLRNGKSPGGRRGGPKPWIGASAALLAGFLAAAPAAAMSYRREVIPGLSSLAAGYESVVELADVDGDGDVDAVVGEGSGRILLFANQGTAPAPAFVEISGAGNPFRLVDLQRSAKPKLADLDDDGDLDLLVGSVFDPLRYFANVGSRGRAFYVERRGSANPFAGVAEIDGAPELADLDADGDLDALIGLDDRFLYLENAGSAARPLFVERRGKKDPFSSVAVAELALLQPRLVDLDADGDLDLLFGELEGRIFSVANSGSPAAPAFAGRPPFAEPIEIDENEFLTNVALADLDGDGDRDAVVGASGGQLFYLTATGSPSSPIFTELKGGPGRFGGFEVGYESVPALGDLDADGDLDALIGNGDGRLSYRRNVGSPGAPLFVPESPSDIFVPIDVEDLSSPELADLDGDGDLDLMLGSFLGPLSYFRNQGSAGAPLFVQQAGGANPFDGILVGFSTRPRLADLDGDGDLDAAVGHLKEPEEDLAYLENVGGPLAPDFQWRQGIISPFYRVEEGSTQPALADLDGDGDLDLLLGSNSQLNGLLHYENLGSAPVPLFVARPAHGVYGDLFLGNRVSAVVVDFDQDGDLDIFGGNRNGRIHFLRASRDELFADGFESGGTLDWSSVSADP